DANLALQCASKHLDINDEVAWKRRWKQVELLDVRDLFMLLYGRSESVLSEIEYPENFEIVRDRVMVGMHWGPAISILKLLANKGMEPTFPYRPPEPELLRRRPFYYLFSKQAVRYLSVTLGDRAVSTGGAARVLQQLMGVPGSICVLMDAPAQKGRPARVRQLLGTPATFNVGLPAMLVEQGKEYVLYAMNLADDGTARKKLEIRGPFNASEVDEYLDSYVRFLDGHLSADSSQWRIWRAEHQVWTESSRKGDHQ
ncbi:hypothetical protein ACFL07_11935, partial [Pseudomonadota bacterium]